MDMVVFSLILNALGCWLNIGPAKQGSKISQFFVIFCGLSVIYNLIVLYGRTV